MSLYIHKASFFGGDSEMKSKDFNKTLKKDMVCIFAVKGLRHQQKKRLFFHNALALCFIKNLDDFWVKKLVKLAQSKFFGEKKEVAGESDYNWRLDKYVVDQQKKSKKFKKGILNNLYYNTTLNMELREKCVEIYAKINNMSIEKAKEEIKYWDISQYQDPNYAPKNSWDYDNLQEVLEYQYRKNPASGTTDHRKGRGWAKCINHPQSGWTKK